MPVAQDAAPTAQSPAQASSEGLMSRWLDINTMSFSLRYRNSADTDGWHLFEFGQQRSLLDGRFKLDKDGRYSINFHMSSGRYFNWAYADEIGGNFADKAAPSLSFFPAALQAKFYQTVAVVTATFAAIQVTGATSRGWEFYPRQLYLSARPIDQVAFEYGGLGIERGAGSEMTTFDEDGYIVGERLRFRDPEHLYVDQVAVTYGYMGDYFNPDFITRADRLGQSNYHQFLVEKHFGKRLKASADYTWVNTSNTMREAALVKVPEARIIDSARIELYQRTNDVTLQGFHYASGSGFGFTGSKTFHKVFTLEGGYASIDQNYTVYSGSSFLSTVAYSLNGDAFGVGNRFFTRANYKVKPYLTLFGFYNHQVNTDFYTVNRQGLNGGLTLDFKNILSDKLHWL